MQLGEQLVERARAAAAVVALGLALAPAGAGCRCAGGGLGTPCATNADCNPGLYCAPRTMQCTGTLPGTDGGAGPGTDAAPGTDAGGGGLDSGGGGGSVCGNGVVEPGEQCDPPGPSCTATCQLGGDACAAGVGVLACGSVLSADNGMAGSASLNSDYGSVCAADGVYSETGPEVAYTFVTPVDQRVTLDLVPLGADLDLAVLSGAPACDPSTCFAGMGTSGPEQVTIDALAGVVYYVVVDGFMGQAGAFDLTVSCAPPLSGSGTCADPYVVAAPGPTATSFDVSTCGAGDDLDAPFAGDCDPGANGADLVYRIDLAVASTVTLDLQDVDPGAAVDTVVYVRSDCGAATTMQFCSDDFGSLGHSHLDLFLAAGTWYVIVDSYDYTSGNGTAFGCGNVHLDVTVGS